MHRCDFLTPDTLFHLPAKNSLVKAAPQINIGLIAHIISELTQLKNLNVAAYFARRAVIQSQQVLRMSSCSGSLNSS